MNWSRRLSALRLKKPAMKEDDYYSQFEKIMVETGPALFLASKRPAIHSCG